MNAPIARIALGLICATMLSSISLAQTATKHVPGKAPLPAKPPTVTAVVPRLAGSPGGQREIIFVGGHAQSLDEAALNPQPIPPGHLGLVNPPR